MVSAQFGRAELSAAGALVAYLELTQKGKFPALKPLKREGETGRHGDRRRQRGAISS